MRPLIIKRAEKKTLRKSRRPFFSARERPQTRPHAAVFVFFFFNFLPSRSLFFLFALLWYSDGADQITKPEPTDSTMAIDGRHADDGPVTISFPRTTAMKDEDEKKKKKKRKRPNNTKTEPAERSKTATINGAHGAILIKKNGTATATKKTPQQN